MTRERRRALRRLFLIVAVDLLAVAAVVAAIIR